MIELLSVILGPLVGGIIYLIFRPRSEEYKRAKRHHPTHWL